MPMKELWSKEQESRFFIDARKFAEPQQLFYHSDDDRYYAYWPKNYRGSKTTLQARNSLIGTYTERWTTDLLREFAKSKGYHAIQGAICDEIGLPKNSSADVAISKTENITQKPEDIILIAEVKMSIVWNWELKGDSDGEKIVCIGDFKTHSGNPGLLRSDTMLKAIGKSINIRVSNYKTSRIPIIVFGNTPITKSYYGKVDYLLRSGIIQGFWSVNPKPLDNDGENIKSTEKQGFYRIDSYNELISKLDELFSKEITFFSSICSKDELGKFIEIADKEKTYEEKAEKFLSLIRNG